MYKVLSSYLALFDILLDTLKLGLVVISFYVKTKIINFLI